MNIAAFVLAMMMWLVPGRARGLVDEAKAITSVVEAESALFPGDKEKLLTAALVVTIAFRESGFRNEAVSETEDYCMMQVHRRPDLAKDVGACVKVAFVMLRESIRMCPRDPVAFYASGPGGCSNARAQRISQDRMGLAKRLVREVGR